MEPTTVVSTLTGGIADADTQMLQIGGAALGVGVVVLLLRRGWGLVKSFTK